MAQANAVDHRISAEEYLQGELLAEFKHELIDGEVYAMAGASEKHNLISANMLGEIYGFLKGKPCRPYTSDMKVKAGDDFFYPDVMVVCEDVGGDDYYTESPVIIVEVLSRSTRKTDETIKRWAYQSISSLQEYVLIEQDFVDIEVVRRNQDWRPMHYFLGDEVPLESIDLTLSVEDIYARVQNEDMIEHLAK